MSGVAKSSNGVFVAPRKRDLDELARSLESWLCAKLPQAADLQLSNFQYPMGAGQSHETILFDAAWREGDILREQGMVVRIKPTTFTVYVDDMFTEQHRIMSVMRDSGRVPVAEIFWVEEDSAILGAPFFVMEKFVGRVAVTIPSYLEEGWIVDLTPPERERLWCNGMRNLAAIQKVPVEAAAFLHRPADGDHFMQEWNRWDRFLQALEARAPIPFHREVQRRLAATFPAHRPEGIVWGDARLGNMMADDGLEIIAVMDWEHPGLGGALHDLGWWVFNERLRTGNWSRNLDGLGSRETALALWSEQTGISTADFDWYEAFAALKISCTAWSLYHLRDQPYPDLNETDMGRATSELLDSIENGRG